MLNKNYIVTSEYCAFSGTMGDNGIFYIKLVKATLITIVMLGHHGRGTMDMIRGTMDISMVPQYGH